MLVRNTTINLEIDGLWSIVFLEESVCAHLLPRWGLDEFAIARIQLVVVNHVQSENKPGKECARQLGVWVKEWKSETYTIICGLQLYLSK